MSTELLLVLAVALPLLGGLLATSRRFERIAGASAPWAPVPALLVALGSELPVTAGHPHALLAALLGVRGPLDRAFLLLTASTWLASGVYARAQPADARQGRFWCFFLLTEAGNIGVCLARDVASFYCFFALMTFAAYGLVLHAESAAARRAGRVYITMAVLGEMCLLAAFLLIVGADINAPLSEVPERVARASSPRWIAALLLAGFGVKAGALLLHLWLPLAHPVAPTPASAVLSGSMIKAGVLGWLRFLPLGETALPSVGRACVLCGVAGAFYGAAVGVTQREPKTVLAYSSVSQMGFMLALTGVALGAPALAPLVLAAVTTFAVHHALVKAALFLGTGVAHAESGGPRRAVVIAGLALSAWSLAGGPLSSGALAKLSIERAGALAPPGAAPLFSLLSVAAVGSALLMLRFSSLALAPPAGGGRAASPGKWLSWSVLVVLPLGLAWIPVVPSEPAGRLLEPGKLWAAAWPLALAAALGASAARLDGSRRLARVHVPPGDALVPIEAAVIGLRRLGSHLTGRAPHPVPAARITHGLLVALERRAGPVLERAEVHLARFGVLGLMVLLVCAALASLIWI